MAFPATGILDNFNRANESPLGSPWQTDNGNNLCVSSNVCAPIGVCSRMLWGNTVGNDQEAFFTVATRPIQYQDVAVILRSQGNGEEYWCGYGTGENGAAAFYILHYYGNGQYDYFTEYAVSGGADGDKIWATAIGDVITLYYCPNGSSTWTQVLQYTDMAANRLTSGKIGIMVYESTARVDDFGGGTCASGTAYSVSSSLSAAPGMSHSAAGAFRGSASVAAAAGLSCAGPGTLGGTSALSAGPTLSDSTRGVFASSSPLVSAPGLAGTGLVLAVAASAIQAASALAGSGGSLFSASAGLAATLNDVSVAQAASLVAHISITDALDIAAGSKASMAAVAALAASAQAAFYGTIPGVGRFLAFVIDDEPVTFFV